MSEKLREALQDKNLKMLVAEIQPYAEKPIGTLRIDMDDVRSILTMYAVLLATQESGGGEHVMVPRDLYEDLRSVLDDYSEGKTPEDDPVADLALRLAAAPSPVVQEKESGDTHLAARLRVDARGFDGWDGNPERAALMRQAADALERLSPDVVRLVIAARVVAFERQDAEALKELDAASEAFAGRVPWEDEPHEEEDQTDFEAIRQASLNRHWDIHQSLISDTDASTPIPTKREG